MSPPSSGRVGGHVVADSLQCLGCEVAFGLPGVHSLGIWEGLRSTSIRAIPFRTELNAGFAADGYSRVSGRPAPLLLSTGPGALIGLAALMEAASSHVPVVAISSQIPRPYISRGRGYLHELSDQIGSFAPIVKWAARAETVEALPGVLAEAWGHALAPPPGPVFVEIPADVLLEETDLEVRGLDVQPSEPPRPDDSALGEAARILLEAKRPLVWAGSGVLRAGAWAELVEFAERLDAPVVSTFMGKGAFPEDHPLFVSSACYDVHLKVFIESADAVVCIGTELGSETTYQYSLRFGGPIVQIDVARKRIGSTYPAHALVGDASRTLGELSRLVPKRTLDGRERAATARARLAAEVARYAPELALLASIRRAMPPQGITAWDMTIVGYNASGYFEVPKPRTFLYPLGSGTLGYAWPAAIGARLALDDVPVLATVGDGGIHYGLTELATALQYGIDAKLLVVDDGAYGILKLYQEQTFQATTAVELLQPDFSRLAMDFGVQSRVTTRASLADDVAWALDCPGPVVLVLPTKVELIEPA